MLKVEIYVQARMGSTRLPGKVMKTVLGKPLLAFLIERLKQCQEANAFAILTTTSPADEEIVSLCRDLHVLCYRGEEDNVLARYYHVALKRRPDAVVRITADCPLIDPEVIDLIIQTYRNDYPNLDYLSNSLERTYPRGLDVEIFSFEALERTFKEAHALEEKEHVTPYMYTHPEKFRLKNLALNTSLANYRWTVDTKEDFELIRLILENLYPLQPHFRLADILKILQTYPEWNQINAHIEQKKLK